MGPNGVRKRIVWAVDPFATTPEVQRAAARVLGDLSRRVPTLVQPVYAWVPPTLAATFDFTGTFLREAQYRAREGLAGVLGAVTIPGLQPLELRACGTGTLRNEVNCIIDYAESKAADMLVVSTRARKGPGRWFTGSFTETVMLQSSVPTLVVNPELGRGAHFRKILFATDFSDESIRAFREVVTLARALGSRLIVYHRLPGRLSPPIDVTLVSRPLYGKLLIAEQRERERDGQRLVRLARRAGVRCELILDASPAGSVSEGVLSEARARNALIAMVGRSGRLSSALLGSTTRRVVRTSPLPVWVLHAERSRRRAAPEVSAAPEARKAA